VYLFLALFWLGVGILLQVFWESFAQFAHIPVERTTVGVFCFILMSYNFMRWRLAHMMNNRRLRANAPSNERREPREYDPNLDFSQADHDQPDKPKRPD
jgi:hypothetical protein